MPLPRDKTTTDLGLKVGDRFRVVNNGEGTTKAHPLFRKGDVVTLSRDDGDDCPSFRGDRGELCCYLWRLEPLARLETTAPHKFKVGDRVRLKSLSGNGAPYTSGSIGMTGRVTDIRRPLLSRDIELDNSWHFWSGDLELLYRPCPTHSPGLCCCDPAETDKIPLNSQDPSVPPVGTRILIIQRYMGWQPVDSQIDHARSGMAGTVVDPYTTAPKDKGAFYVDTDDGKTIIMSNCDHYEILDRPPQPPNCKPAIQDYSAFTHITMPTSPYEHTFSSPSHKAQPKGVSIMSHLTTLAKKAFDKPTKTLIQARVLNDDLSINDGEFILAVLVDLNKDALVKAAQERLDEEKAESK